jgi:ATP-binding cassette, subfamily B, bacterial HlyB/CyaB
MAAIEIAAEVEPGDGYGIEDGGRIGLECLSILARHHGIDVSAGRMAHDYAVGNGDVPPERLLRIARELGLRSRLTRLRARDLAKIGGAFPIMACLRNGNWVVLLDWRDGEQGTEALVRDPLALTSEPFVVAGEQLVERWDGRCLLVKRASRITDPNQPFGLRWFYPELIRQRRLLIDVAVAAIFLYLLGLAVPIFVQIVIDKVLLHQAYATLVVLTVGVTLALVFDAIFTFLRRYLLLYATNRIDIRVSTRTFAHLLNLPIDYFEGAPAGVIVKHMQQGSRIREFLTGRLFLTLLDALSLIVFIPVLLLYSVTLSLIVGVFTLVIALAVVLLVGPYQRRLRTLYEAEAQRQQLLVESIHGMRTIKSIAMEPVQCRQWDDRSAAGVEARFELEKLSSFAQAAIGFLEKLMMVAIIGFGTMQVFNEALTVGALIAFNMLAARVSGPLVQIVTMVHEYQEVALSVRMLGEVMNRRPERDGRGRGIQLPIQGDLEFKDVTFRYGAGSAAALREVSFEVPQGSIFGIVGRSGSGKTTITRLIQGLYPVEDGVIRLDGMDLREIDLVHLRGNTGVVLQDSFLFRGTVRENIAAPKPGASFEEVVIAARLAGADEFIERLPRGFDTHLEEKGENLSGGQRQRLAIARALITDPRLLILDEATSALDPESEFIIRQNLRRIARSRTVIIVSHRLASLAEADNIVVLDRGTVVGMGNHRELLAGCAPYRHLWHQQTRSVV